MRYPFHGRIIPALSTTAEILSGAKMYVYLAGSTSPTPSYIAATGPSTNTNPVVANSAGRFGPVFLDADIAYRIKVTNAGGTDTLYDEDNIRPALPTDVALYSALAGTGGAALIGTADGSTAQEQFDNLPPVGVQRAVSRAAIAALDAPVTGDAVFLMEAGREGIFVFSTANLSTQVSADTLQGIYVAPSGGSTGASGAWVRRFSGARNVRWWGAKGDGVTDDLPAFNAAMASFSTGVWPAAEGYVGGELLIPKHDPLTAPATKSGYFLNGTWRLRKGVKVRGEGSGWQPDLSATRLLVPTNTDAVGLESEQVSSAYDPQSSSISDLCIQALVKGASGRGVYSSVRFYLEKVIIQNFGGHGVEIAASPPSSGNADFFSLKHVDVIDCGGDGFKISGSDAQVGTIIGCNAKNNGGWGYNDTSSYGNSYMECHASGNTSGSYRARTATTYYGSCFWHCYVEGAVGFNTDFDENTLVFGGTLAGVAGNASTLSFFSPGGFGLNVPTGGRHMWFRNLVEVMRYDNDNVLKMLAGININGGTAGRTISMADNLATHTTNVNTSVTHVAFVNGNGTVGTIATNGSATAYNTSSDYRLKKNRKVLTGALDRIMALKPISFDWKGDNSAGKGFLAHELQKVIPEAVTGDKDARVDIGKLTDANGEVIEKRIEKPATIAEGMTWTKTGTKPLHQGVDLSKIIPDLVAAVQELSAMARAQAPTDSLGASSTAPKREATRGKTTPGTRSQRSAK